MQFIILQLCLFIFLSPALVWSSDKIQGFLNTDVQLQENGYIKIIGRPQVVRSYLKSTDDRIEKIDLPESDNEQINDALMKKYDLKESEKHFSRNLIVFFQFLKPCTATMPSTPPHVENELKALEELKRTFYEVPRFRCDYRFKVFVTFFSDGEEVETQGEYPVAYWTDSRRVDRKLEMLPGEKSELSFLIPKDHLPDYDKLWEAVYGKKLPPRPPRVASWKTWVPK